MDNIIRAVFCGSRYATTKSAWLIDHGMVLKLSGVELPEVYEVDFSNSKTSAAKRVLGNADGVVIPDEYFLNKARQIYAWVYLTTGDSGYTVLQVTIPLTQRPEVTDEPPTPQETDLIEQAIAALNDGVERAETAAEDAEQSAEGVAESEANAAESARLAKLSEDNAALSEDNAKESETNAAASERNAAQSEQNAAESARRAKANADAADESRQGAQTAAEDAESAAREAETAANNAERIERELPDTIADALQEAKESGEFDGKDGEDGKDGANGVTYTPTVDADGNISWVNDGDLPNPQTRNIKGPAGKDGSDGEDGFSPTITVVDIEGGHRVTITDETGPHSFDVMDGSDSGGAVDDVQINGTSIVDADGVANIPLGGNNVFGAVAISPSSGLFSLASLPGVLFIEAANEGEIKYGTPGFNYKPITPARQALAAFYGLAQAAGASTMRDTLPPGQYTETEKSAISEMLNGSVAVSGTTPTITALPGVRYVCGEVSTLDITIPASGIVDVTFTSGSTATVLTITPPSGQTLKWANGFDPSALEANTTYEINIMDGLGVAASWT